jgi:hypothetical protein
MTPTTQSGLHPDAEALNAFAEHALPDAERQQILAHTAECSRCRQVLFLAQQAAGAELPSPATEAVVLPFQPNKARVIPIRVANWRFAGAAAAAAVVLVALSLFLLPKHTPPSQQAARSTSPELQSGANLSQPTPKAVRPPESLQSPQLQAKPKTTPRNRVTERADSTPSVRVVFVDPKSGAVTEAPPAQAAPAPQAPGSGAPAPSPLPAAAAPPSTAQAVEVQAEPLPASGSETVTVDASAQAVVSPPPQKTANLSPQPVAPLSNPIEAQFQMEKKGPAQTAKAEDQKAQHGFGRAAGGNARASQPASTAGASGTTGGTLGALASPMTARSIDRMADRLAASKQPSSDSTQADLEAARTALHATLLGGSTAISTASAQHLLLAVDAGGSLFLSNDAGKTWQPVLQQWTGKATLVRSLPRPQPTPSDGAAAKPGAAASPLAPPALFELTASDGSLWTSADGKSWIKTAAPARIAK